MEITVTLNLLSILEVRRTVMRFTVDTEMTMDEVIELVDRENPGFKQAVLNEDGELSRQFAFFIDGTNIHSFGGLQAPVRAPQTVNVIPAISGG